MQVMLRRVSRLLLFAAMLVTLVSASLPDASQAQEATPAGDCPATTPEENKALARAYWEEVVWGPQGKIAEIVAPDEVHHWGGLVDETQGLEAFSQKWEGLLQAFPDLDTTVEIVAAQDDLVATYWTETGTHSGEFAGIAPTGKEVTFSGVNIFRIECGQIAEAWGQANNLGILAQIGSPDVPAFLADAARSKATPMAGAAVGTPCAGDTPEANLALVERWTNEVWVGQDLAVVDEIFAPDIVHHGAGFPDAHGREAVKKSVQSQLDIFPDMDLAIDQAFTDGNLAVVRWSGSGTNEGEFIGHAPTGQETTISGINIYHVNCGQIVESWSEFNGLDILRQVMGEAMATPEA